MSKLMLVAVLFASFACKKKEETGAAAPAAKPAATAPAPEGSAAPAPTPAAEPAAAAAGTPAMPAAAGAPVDTCAMMPADKVEPIAGKLVMPPSSSPATGSMLGSCMSATDKGIAVAIEARPVGEFDATASASKGKEVAGIGEKASMTEHGLMVKVAGKPYFLHVMATDTKTTKQDEAMATALAKIAVENAK